MNKSLMKDIKMIIKGAREITKKSPRFLLITCLYALFQSVQPFISIYFSAKIIDGILIKAPLQELIYLVIWLVGLECICTIIMKCVGREVTCIRESIIYKIRLELSEKLHRIDYEKVEDPEFQRQKEKIESAEQRMGMGLFGIAEILPNLLKQACTILWSVVLTGQLFLSFDERMNGWQGFVCSPVFSILSVGVIVASVFVNMRIVAKSGEEQYEMFDGVEKLESIVNYYNYNYIGNYHIGKDIRIYNQKPLIMEELQGEYGKLKDWYQALTGIYMKYGNLGAIVSVSISGLVYLFVGLKALAGLFSVGSIVQYIGSINQFVTGFTEFMKELTRLRANNEAVGYYFDYMAISETNVDEGVSVDSEVKEIAFHNVSFKYPGTNDYVLRNLSVKFHADKKVAIVGMNGSGKTTLIKLLCRFYKPTEGKITLNGIDIHEYKYGEYMGLMSVVFQDFKLFGYTLGENVATSVEADEARVKEVLVKAGFEDRYQKLEEGINTYLYKDYSENGMDISGGEAQKIAIARALYKDAPIVILDEPTAALDPISEYEIYSHFNQMVEDKMSIFISHRLSSCRFCDEIVVMDEGKIVQLGSHEVLVADESGKYYELWNAQAQYYQEEVDNEKRNKSIPIGMAHICQ